MLALGGVSVSALHLLLLPTQIYSAHLHTDFTAGAHCWEKLGWICPGVRLREERGREGGGYNIGFQPGLLTTQGGRAGKGETAWTSR